MAYTKELYANNARTTLAGSLTNVATSIVLQTGAGALFPSPNNAIGEFAKATLQDAATGLRNEIVYITAKTGDVLTVVRGQDGTTAQTWSAGDTVFEGVTAATLGNFLQPVDVQDGHLIYAEAAGSTTAYTASLSPAIASLVEGMPIYVDFGSVGSNTVSNPTLNVNGLGAKTIVKQYTNQTTGATTLIELAVNDLPKFGQLQYSSASSGQWVLLNPAQKGRLINVQKVTTAGTSTYTKTAGMTWAIVEVQGAGGGGGGAPATAAGQFSSGGGGSAGGYAKSVLTRAELDVAAPITMTVGAKGVGASNSNGTAGGSTSFGSLLSATGGGAGLIGSTATVPSVIGFSQAAGVGSGGNIENKRCQQGGYGFSMQITNALGGLGGSSQLGTGGFGGSNSNGNTASGYGAGGGGASNHQSQAAKAGGDGTDGAIFIYEYA